MSNKLSLSVILPIKSSKAKNFEDYFEKAISSLKTQQVGFEELIIVHTNEESLVTNETLQDYQNFQTAGSVFKKEIIEDFGGFKSSMKLTFIYEFLLRLTYNSVSIMTIPKLGYKHVNLREGSIFWNYKNGDERMVEDEVKFWIQTAKKEYFFTDDRVIKYQSENV